MLASQSLLVSAYPAISVPVGATLLRRAQPADSAIFVESGRVLLGILGNAQHNVPSAAGMASPMEHLLGVVEGPAWLEANTVVLDMPSAVDAIAETGVVMRRVPVPAFRASLQGGSLASLAVLTDLARAHRQQTEFAVSRLAKDAEARCAEWLLRHAESSDKGGCSVKLLQRKRMIAAQLGIAPETLSRVLRHLRERSLISGSGRILNLVDPSGLRSLAGI